MSIASEISRLQSDSSAIAAAIAAKGVTVPSGSGFDDYATLIGQISSGGGGSSGPFPGSFVSYLEATGTQYVDTGYVPKPETEITVDMQLTQAVEGPTIIGMYKSSNSQQRFHIGTYKGQWHFGVSNYNAGNTWKNITAVAFDTQRHTLVIRGDGYCAVDSSTAQISVNNSSSYINFGSLAIFAQHTVGAAPWKYDGFASMKVYSIVVKESGTIVHNYRPCRVGQVGLFYDTISGNFYSNFGTGSFSYGSDVQA